MPRLRPIQLSPVLFFTVLLSVSQLHAQSSLSLSPTIIFLNAKTGGGPVQQTFAVTSSAGAGVSFAAALGSASWLSISSGSAITPATLSLTANPSGLTAGVYSTTISVSGTNAGAATGQVVFTISDPGAMISTPSGLFFTYQAGAPPQPQYVTLLSPNGAAASTYLAQAFHAPWLQVNQNGDMINVGIDTSTLTPGNTYVDAVEVIPADSSGNLLIPVVVSPFSVPQISAAPSSVSFLYQAGAVNQSQQQTVTVTPPGGNLNVMVVASDGSTPSWLSVSNTGGVLTVTSFANNLSLGSYQANIVIAEIGGNTITVPVTLTISNQPFLSVSPQSLSYTYQVGGANPPDQTITPNTGSNGSAYTVTASSAGNWLSANASNPVTPNATTVSVNPAGLAVGTYTGTLTFAAGGVANSPVTATVTLTVTNNPALSASPNPLIFNYEVGQVVPPAQTVSVSSGGTPVSFTATGSGASWLFTSAVGSMNTPASFAAGVNPAGLALGTYNGSILLTSPGAAAQVSVPVILNVSNVALLNVPSSISLSSPSGAQPGQAGQSQLISVSSTGEAVNYSVGAIALTPAGSTWLAVGSPSGPATNSGSSGFIVVVNPTGLSAGAYKGLVVLHPSNGTADISIPVTYTITTSGLTATPATLGFFQTANGPAPAWQFVSIGGSGSPNYTVSTSTSAQVNWLSVSPSSGTAPGVLTVSVNAGNLPVGVYTGTITVNTPNGPPQVLTVSLTVVSP